MNDKATIIETEENSDRLSSIRDEIAFDVLSSEKAHEMVSLNQLIQWLDNIKAENHMRVKRVGLSTLTDWGYDGQGYYSHREGKFFRFVGMCVRSEGREVSSWCQPIMDNIGTGIIAIVLGRHNGRLHFLMQAKADVGNRSGIQIAPTVQFTPSNYKQNQKLSKPFLYKETLDGRRFEILWEGWQSEEGGRFFKEQQQHMILMLRDGNSLGLPREYIWMTPAQVRFFLHIGENVNACARSILSCLI